jgi:uncharacterized protein
MPFGMAKLTVNPTLLLVAIASLIGSGVLLLGCYQQPTVSQRNPSQSNPEPTSSPATTIVHRTPSQILPIKAKAKLMDQPFELEVAETQAQQTLGLMYRKFLPSNRGMLFPFNPARPVQFWMKHCEIALDIIFLRDGKVVAIAAKAPPCTSDPCPTYGPDELVDQVIEIQAGRAEAIELTIGQPIKIEWINPPKTSKLSLP